MADAEERLLVGEAIDREPLPDAFATFVDDVRGELIEPPGEETAAGHLRTITLAVRDAPVAAPPRRLPALRRLRPYAVPRLRPRVAAGLAAALAVCSSIGLSGALPAPVQATLADASRAVGIEIVPPPERKAKPSRSRGTQTGATSRPVVPSHSQLGPAGRAPAPPAPADEAPPAAAEPFEQGTLAPPAGHPGPWAPLPPEEAEPEDQPGDEMPYFDEGRDAPADEPATPQTEQPTLEEEP